jgi:hypothetical protein
MPCAVQPNGGGKELHIKFESEAGVHLLDEIATAALLKPTLTGQEAESVQTNEQPPQEVEPVKPEAEQVKSEAEKLKAMPDKQGIDRLNSELLEEEQDQKALSSVAKEHVSEQVTTASFYQNCCRPTNMLSLIVFSGETSFSIYTYVQAPKAVRLVLKSATILQLCFMPFRLYETYLHWLLIVVNE